MYRKFIVLLLIAALFVLGGCDTEPTQPTTQTTSTAPSESTIDQTQVPTTAPKQPFSCNWTMQGHWVSVNGEILETLELSFACTVTPNASKLGEDLDEVAANISLPDTFPYQFKQEQKNVRYTDKYLSVPYYASGGCAFTNPGNAIAFAHYAFCPEKQFAIFSWENTPSQFLVASVDPNVDPKEILEYFATFVDKFGNNY